MKRKFTFLIAALALLTMIVQPLKAVGQTWEKITSTDDLVSGGTYLLVYESSTTAGWIYNGNDAANNYAEAAISNGVISTLPNPNTAAPVIITSIDGGHSIQIVTTATNHPGKYLSGTNGSNTTNFTDNAVANTITFVNDAVNIVSNTSVFNFNSTSNNNRFRYFKSTTANNDNYKRPALYIMVASGGNTTATTTTIDATGIINTDVYSNTAAGSLSATVEETESGNPVSGATVTWESSDEDVATIDEYGVVTLVAAGTTTITASYAGVSGEFAPSYATYELTVTSSAPYVQPTTVEINMNYQWLGSGNGQNLNQSQLPVVNTDDNVTTTITDGKSNRPRGDSDYIRLYAGSTLTFDAPSGYEIASIVFTTGGTGTWNNPSVSSGLLDSKTWTGNAASVEFTMNGTCFISKATITLAEPATRYEITYATGLANGGFATSGNPTDAAADENVTVTTVPAAGYHLATMTYNDGTTTHDATVSGNIGSFTMPAADVTVSATFAENVATFTDGVYSETMITQASFDNMTPVNVNGDQVWHFDNNGYACVNGYDGGANHANEDWLITPKLAVENGKLDISFETWHNSYGDGQLSVKWSSSNDISGSWTTMDGFTGGGASAFNPSSFTITTSEPYVYVAFVYVSTSSASGKWELKNFTAKQYYTITLSATNGDIMSDPEDLAVVGANVELVALPNSGYHFVSWAVTPSSVTIENDEFTMPAENVSINTVYELDNTYTITFNENGQTIEDDFTSGPIGSNLPTTPFGAIPANLTFFGWSTSPIDTYTETAPELVNAAYNISSNATFYAVYKYDYSYTEGGSPATWRKVTDASTLAVGDQLVIASDAQGKVAGEIASSVMGEVAATFDNSVMASLPSGAVVLTLGGKSGVWTLANSSDQLLGATAVKKLAWGSGTTTWNIVIDDDGKASICNGTSSYGRFLHNVNSTRFTTYTSDPNASMLVPQLYRLEGGTTPVSGSYYLTSVTERGTNASISTATTWDGNNTINAEIEIEIDGATLTVGGLLINPDVDNIFIENGGQLIAKGKGVKATVWKDIDGYSGDGGWNLIASPLAENTTPEFGNGFLVGDYDLYYHDEATSYWMNYENSPFNIQPNKGYLYATDEATGTILEFAGAINPSNENITISGLTNTSAVGVAAGYNLVGNPFTCTAYLSDGRDFYHMNSAGNDIVVKTNNAINVCEGVFVQCAANETVTFTTTDPSVTSTGNNNGMVNISVAQMVNTRDAQPSTDIARIRINNGENMTKFVFNENNSHVYIPQDGNDYAVVRSEAHGEMPVNFKAAENGTYTISVETENLDVNYLHLIDNMTGTDVDLLATPNYTFEARKSDYASRFKLVFSTNADNNEVDEDFAFISDGNIIVLCEGEATLQVIDIMGRVISTQTVNGNASVNNVGAAGVYVLQLINGNNVKTQKIVVR